MVAAAIGSSIIETGANLLGGWLNRNAQEKANEKNAALQREFAQNGIQWKMEDAKKAGVHGLYALGAQTMSASPSYVGDTSLGSAVAASGQSVSRAAHAASTAPTKTAVAMEQLALERGALENELLRSQIAQTRQISAPHAPMSTDQFFMPGQGDSGWIKQVPHEITSSKPGQPFAEAGTIPELGFSRTALGGFAPVMSKDFKDRSEDDLLAELAWHFRNNIIPLTSHEQKGKIFIPGLGYHDAPKWLGGPR